MVLLYMRRPEEALELIDHVLSMVNPETETKIAVWGMRGLAFYHYTQGNIKASHAAMQRTMDIALPVWFPPPHLFLSVDVRRAGGLRAGWAAARPGA